MDYSRIIENISALAEEIVKCCAESGCKISTAESCTGGMISAAITAVPGSSAVIELGICAYSNRIKRELLGVSERTLAVHTEYSGECAEEMAAGAARAAQAAFGIATSGIAGPTGGTDNDPVGTVYIGAYNALTGSVRSEKCFFEPISGVGFTARDYIRAAATEKALRLLQNNMKARTGQ